MANKKSYMDYNETVISYEVHKVAGVRLTKGDEVHTAEKRTYVGCRPFEWFFDGVLVDKAEARAKCVALAAQGFTQEQY